MDVLKRFTKPTSCLYAHKHRKYDFAAKLSKPSTSVIEKSFLSKTGQTKPHIDRK